MRDLLRYAGQAGFFAVLALFIGYFSASPAYRQVPDGMAQIKLSLRHGGARVEDCRKLTPEEIAKLPANERRPNTCSRERLPMLIEIRLDGAPLYSDTLYPTGLSSDGPAETYRKFIVPAGRHVIEARLRDSKRTEGFDYETVKDIDLAPFQNLAVDFKSDQGGFLFR
jgi:hypothetical protein